MEKLKAVFGTVKNFVLKRKLLSIIILLILGFAIYKIFFNSNAKVIPTYSVEEVSRQTIISTLSESGQVSVDGSIDLKPNGSVSGKITSLKIKPGDKISAGQLVATIDSTNAYRTLQSAKLSYQNALISYQKQTSPSSSSTILSAQNSLSSSKASLSSSYTTAFNNITSTYSDMSSIVSSLHDAIYSTDLNSSQYNIFYFADNAHAVETKNALTSQANILANLAMSDYTKIKTDYDNAFISYKMLSTNSSDEDIYNSLKSVVTVSTELSNSLKSVINLMQYYQDLYNRYSLTVNSKASNYLTSMKSAQATINSDVSSLNNIKNNIDNLVLTIPEQELNLSTVSTGVTGLDLDSAKVALNQAELNYEVAKESYANYFVTSPIDGVISSVNTFVGADSSSNSIATIITKGKFANLSVSEADIPKIKLGQKATLTFDAIDNFSLVGTVSEINQSGSVSSGVVSYVVKIAFDDPSDQVKSGMSVTADIQIGIATDVLAIPNSALHSSTNSSYVNIFSSMNDLATSTTANGYTSSVLPSVKSVDIGLVGNDYTEIKSGLNEGDIVVTKTNSSSSTAKTTTTSNTRIPGMGGFGR